MPESDREQKEQDDKKGAAIKSRGRIVDSLWKLLASPRFAVLLLGFIALTALAGAFLPQQPSQQQLHQLTARWGETWVAILNALNFFDLYHSRWFRASLALLCISIFICSLERLPGAWRLIRKRDAALAGGDPERLRIHHRFDYSSGAEEAAGVVRNRLRKKNLRAREETRGENHWLFINRGAYSRLGVYVIHSSIILVVIGAIIGNLFGFEGTLPIREGEKVDSFFLRDKKSGWMPLGFEIQCDKFSFSVDPQTGMAGNYESKLVIFDSGKEVNRVRLRVNHPYHHGGMGFYQSSYELYRDKAGEVGIDSAPIKVFSTDETQLGSVTLPGDGSPVEIPGGGTMRFVRAQADKNTQAISGVIVEVDTGESGKSILDLRPGRKTAPSSGSRIVELIARNLENGSEVVRISMREGEEKEVREGTRVKLGAYFPVFPVHGKEQAAARIFVTAENVTRQHMLFEAFPDFDKGNAQDKLYYSIGKIEQPAPPKKYDGPSYMLDEVDALYWTILDVNHDPGVPVVYTGCVLLLVGLFVAFFRSHSKVWIKFSPGRISMGGTTNRNRAVFEEDFSKLAVELEKLVLEESKGGNA